MQVYWPLYHSGILVGEKPFSIVMPTSVCLRPHTNISHIVLKQYFTLNYFIFSLSDTLIVLCSSCYCSSIVVFSISFNYYSVSSALIISDLHCYTMISFSLWELIALSLVIFWYIMHIKGELFLWYISVRYAWLCMWSKLLPNPIT